jgi:predicted phosphohydrolase
MSVYAISDMHLALSVDKPMDIFGGRWENYMEKLKTMWQMTVSEHDYVVIPGDISWATYLEQAFEDFKFIEQLPGRKIISKGNHDYWWTTASKLKRFLDSSDFHTISFMHNNSFRMGKTLLCGTRGWKSPGDDDFSLEDRKIYNRELQRLELSLKTAATGEDDTVMVAMHYPPFNSRRETGQFVEIMTRYNVKLCIYGHLHSESFKSAVEGNVGGIEFRLVSADYLSFKPLKLEF